ncbi:hypothetical protein BC830DRAFT_1059383, partial [Chytriomyces sp. MP71]
DCGADNVINPREPIRCKECGHRILYKKRTKRSECLSAFPLVANHILHSGAVRSSLVNSLA